MNISKVFEGRRRKTLLIALVLVIAAAAYFVTRDKASPLAERPNQKYFSQLTGQEVTKEVSERPILGVMIENSEEARPQTGLDSAGIVFETVTEGGITRYLALFQENRPEEVGPVRSVRPYFVDWLMGFDASIAHVGGSQEALDMLDQRDAKSMNQFFDSEPYYRRDDREAPHNLYARVKDLIALQKDKGHKIARFDEIPRASDAASAQPAAPNITINFSGPSFLAEFRYDVATNSYIRYLTGQPHVDAATNQPITVKNVVVLKMTGDINAIGEGAAVIYKDGTAKEIRWQKSSYDKRLRLLDETGNQVQLNRGDTWIAAIPGSGTVSN